MVFKLHRLPLIIILLLAAILAGMLFDVFVLGHRARSDVVPAATMVPAKTTPDVHRGLPMRLNIPAIGVDASVDYTGNNAKGEMAVPENAQNVGWYKLGTLPGDAGSSVMAGHVLGLKGEAGIFQHLDKLQKNDLVTVLDGHGDTATFVVRETRLYGDTEQPSEVFNSNDGQAHLNLITCAGEWDKSQGMYLKRLVVFADAVK